MKSDDVWAHLWGSAALILLVLLAVVSLENQELEAKLKDNALAYSQIANDMQINYQLQRDTLRDLAQCEAVRDTLAGH